MMIDGSAHLVCLRLAPDAPIGEMSSKITIETNHPKDPKVEVPITGSIKGHIDIFPDTLFFGLLRQGEGGRKKITISSSADEPLVIEKIDSPLSDLVVRSVPDKESGKYQLVCTLLGTAPAGYLKSEIRLHTNDPLQPEIKVPVYALVEE
ncbi:MAG: hypothetical protein HYX78_03285 [Armatimonadetes bacterium]|nr:hypothetical protein [Armatimonadota bacterium]